jgi:hypothetical protein
MKAFKGGDEFAPDALRARLNAWVEQTGQNQLERAIETADKARDSIRTELRIDQQTLTNPITL